MPEDLLYRECVDAWRLMFTFASGFMYSFRSACLPKSFLRYQDLAHEPARSDHVWKSLGLKRICR